MQLGIRDVALTLVRQFFDVWFAPAGLILKCWKWCIGQCLLIGYILFIRKATLIFLLFFKPWERNSEKCTQHLVRACACTGKRPLRLWVYGNKIGTTANCVKMPGKRCRSLIEIYRKIYLLFNICVKINVKLWSTILLKEWFSFLMQWVTCLILILKFKMYKYFIWTELCGV